MKKLLLAILLLSLSGTAMAHDYYNRHYHSSNNDWLAPALIGGVVGYIIAQPRTVVQQPVAVPVYQQPVYQYQDIYDANCACYRRVLIQIN